MGPGWGLGGRFGWGLGGRFECGLDGHFRWGLGGRFGWGLDGRFGWGLGVGGPGQQVLGRTRDVSVEFGWRLKGGAGESQARGVLGLDGALG